MSDPQTCRCATLPSVIMHKQLNEVPELKGLLVGYVCRPDSAYQYQRCSICGTVWEDEEILFMHGAFIAVFKSMLDADGVPYITTYNPVTQIRTIVK